MSNTQKYAIFNKDDVILPYSVGESSDELIYELCKSIFHSNSSETYVLNDEHWKELQEQGHYIGEIDFKTYALYKNAEMDDAEWFIRQWLNTIPEVKKPVMEIQWPEFQ